MPDGEGRSPGSRIITPLRDLFAAVFFLFFGFGIDTSDVVGALPLALVLAVVTGATKVVTGWWAAARAGVAGTVRSGTVLIARGEFSIVIAGLVVTSGEQPGDSTTVRPPTCWCSP